jgi:hypothetical protein
VEVAEVSLAGTGEAWRMRVVAVRIDPRRAPIRLAMNRDASGRARPWSVADAPAGALVALNAGQFDRFGPWGWVMHDGEELRPPGRGPLAPAVVVDSAGAVRIVPADSIAAVRAAGGVREAFQSYPALLLGDGEIPAALQAPGRGVDVGHRDGRLALGVLPDGRVLVALTRFEALGGALDALPFGATAPEMAAVMGAWARAAPCSSTAGSPGSSSYASRAGRGPGAGCARCRSGSWRDRADTGALLWRRSGRRILGVPVRPHRGAPMSLPARAGRPWPPC